MSNPSFPWHVWVVGVVSLLWNAVGAYDYWMTQTENAEYLSAFTPEQLEYFRGFPAWVVSTWAISVWGSVAGSILILLRRRLAATVFLVVIVTTLLTFLYTYVLSNGLEVMSGSAPILVNVLVVATGILLWYYSRKQSESGVFA